MPPIKKIILYGPESCGKTTLAKTLAKAYNTTWAPEYMRTYLQKKWDDTKRTCEKKDIEPITRGQLHVETQALAKANTFLFCDTSVMQLVVYSKFYYNNWLPKYLENALNNMVLEQPQPHYFLTYYDTPWVADALRDKPFERDSMFTLFETALQTYNLPYTILKGSLPSRIETAKAILKKL